MLLEISMFILARERFDHLLDVGKTIGEIIKFRK
jgi:hypothetical protein